mmetsp:Transcript_48345/g.105244  ORF Transcript_48345/g.105244 Transcript_48345/m.105244 type:complete len:354 (+) Transcript_48345:16-1077(+)
MPYQILIATPGTQGEGGLHNMLEAILLLFLESGVFQDFSNVFSSRYTLLFVFVSANELEGLGHGLAGHQFNSQLALVVRDRLHPSQQRQGADLRSHLRVLERSSGDDGHAQSRHSHARILQIVLLHHLKGVDAGFVQVLDKLELPLHHACPLRLGGALPRGFGILPQDSHRVQERGVLRRNGPAPFLQLVQEDGAERLPAAGEDSGTGPDHWDIRGVLLVVDVVLLHHPPNTGASSSVQPFVELGVLATVLFEHRDIFLIFLNCDAGAPEDAGGFLGPPPHPILSGLVGLEKHLPHGPVERPASDEELLVPGDQKPTPAPPAPFLVGGQEVTARRIQLLKEDRHDAGFCVLTS